jgi:hypothetical protein
MSHGFTHAYAARSRRSSWPDKLHKWRRPVEWMPLPEIASGSQKIYMLIAVKNSDANHFAILCRGAYRVDWGDGAGWQNVNDNVKIEKNLVWDDYVGSPLTAQGWRQALVTVEPNGGNLTSFDVSSIRHSSLSVTKETGLLEACVSGPAINNLLFGGSYPAQSHRLCQRISILGTTNLYMIPNMVRNMTGLTVFEGGDCFINVTNAGAAFMGCSSLESLPLLNMPACTATDNLFVSAVSLKTHEGVISSSIINASNLYQNSGMEKAPTNLDLSNATNISGIFYGCAALTKVPLYDVSKAINATAVFTNCLSLKEVPAFDLSSCTSAAQLFQGCVSLKSVPPLDLPKVTSLWYFFLNCKTLSDPIVLNIPSCISAESAFDYCVSLRSITLTNCGNITNTNNMFYNTGNLEQVTLGGITRGFSIANNRLNAAALDALYTSLGTAAGAQTVTVTGNPGTSGHDPTIATAKGWTVAA